MMRRSFVAAAVLAGLAATPAGAQGLLESYCARLGTEDHFNSNGKRLTDVAAIIRQDRANFHAFGIQDADDMSDGFFSSKDNRARLEAMIRKGTVTRQARRAIVDGTPIICVEIYPDFVNVDVR